MAGIGLVLGGGGVLGVSWHIGVLGALEEAGLDLVGTARVVVGTSAGSVVAARRLLGVPTAALEAEQHEPGALPDDVAAHEPDLEALGAVFGRWTGIDVMDEVTAKECGAIALGARTIDEATMRRFMAETLGTDEWPDRDLRVVAVSCATGARRAWTAADGVALSRAVASSCSVPGMFPPVTVDPASDERFTDGGLWSATSADLLLGEDLDAVAVIEPLSASTLPLGGFARRSLEREVAALRAAGARVEVVSPSERYAAMSMSLMDPTLRPDAVAVGRDDGAAAASRLASLLG
jgi:NTE family protein